MSSPLNEIKTQLYALRADVEFVGLASQLRPRLGPIVQWQAQGDGTALATRFMNCNSTGPEGIYGALLVRLLACLERYMRGMIAEIVTRKATQAASYDVLAEKFGNRNLILTGRLLAHLDRPRDYLSLNADQLIDNLASCRKGNATFTLNALAFSATLEGITPDSVERALDNIDVSDWWDKVGADKAISAMLGTKGNRETGKRARERLKELARWRNHVAHGGDGDIVIPETQIVAAIDFIAAFCAALDTIVR